MPVLPLLPVGFVREDDSGAVCSGDVLRSAVADEVIAMGEAAVIGVGHKFRPFERSGLVWDERGRVGRGLLVLLEGVAGGGALWAFEDVGWSWDSIVSEEIMASFISVKNLLRIL